MRIVTFSAYRMASLLALACTAGCAEVPEEGGQDSTENATTQGTQQALETYATAFNLIASHSGKCVTVQSGNLNDNANIRQWTCDDDEWKRYSLEATTDGYYKIVAKHSNKCLTVINGGTANGTDINQFTCSSSENQRFKAVPMGDGTFSLVAKHSNKCVDITYSGMADGVDLWQWNCNGNANQRFILKPIETRGNLLYGRWEGSGGMNATHSGNRTIKVDYKGPTRNVKFDLWSSADTYLYLLNASGTVVASNDNISTTDSNSRIVATLSSGSYTLVCATSALGVNADFAVSSDYASLQFPNKLFIHPATQFNWIYDDNGTGADDDIAIWRPDMSKYAGYYSIGDVAIPKHAVAPRTTFVVKAEGDVLAPPTGYTKVWDDYGAGGDHDGAFWEPIPPAGYQCIGHVATLGHNMPSTDLIRCIKKEYLLAASWDKIWDDSGSGATHDVAVWQTKPNDYRSLNTPHFKARNHYGDPQLGSAFLSINKSAVANDEYRGGTVTGLRAAQFAPIVHLANDETYQPSSAQFFLPNTQRVNGFLDVIESLGSYSDPDPVFLRGQNPASTRVPVYAEIVHRDNLPVDTTDVIYWMFFPYNLGKSIPISEVDIPGVWEEDVHFGNHVGDWEHLTLRFVDGRPSQIYLAQHEDGATYDVGDKDLSFDDFHPRIYSASGSHGLYSRPGRHVYQTTPVGELADETSTGLEWATYNTVVPFEWAASGIYENDLDFLMIDDRWGNPKDGCGVIEYLSDECVLNDGPVAPLQKGFSQPSFTGFQ
jgi:hypothetical protein